jgi:ferredoxin
LDEGLDFIFSHAVSGIWDIPSHGTAQIDGKKCILCYNCYRACPHAALSHKLIQNPNDENKSDVAPISNDTSNQMHCLSAACYGCGICTGICPANAISLERDVEIYTEDKVEKTLVLSCENSGGASIASFDNIKSVDALTIPCGGLIEHGQLSDALSAYDKVMVVICPDDACRHFGGNKRACAGVKRLITMMETIGLSADRLRIVHVSQAMPKILEEEIGEFLNDCC